MNLTLARVSRKTKIRHRNEINNTFSSLPLAARRILFMAMAQLDSKNGLTEGQIFRLQLRSIPILQVLIYLWHTSK